jgi:hypothetical protein
VIFDESLLAHLVDLLEGVHFFLQLEDSIFEHLDIELILALPARLPHDIDSHFRPIPLLDLPRAPVALALVVLLNVLGVVMLRPLEDSRMVVSSRKV